MARISDTSSYPLTTPAGSDYLIGTDVNDSDKTKTFSVDSLAAYVLGGGSALVVQDLILEGTTNTSTSQAIYGINIITTSTAADLATRLPEPVTGRSTVFINNSTISILVFPSTVGGEINGVVDGYAEIPPDGKAYTFYCTENPLPGAWTWSPPAVGQIQLPTIEVAHTNGVQTSAYGVGVPGFQLINPQLVAP